MKRIILERVEHCKLVKEKSVECGHDCWGKTEWSTEYYVVINGFSNDERNEIKHERVFPDSGWVILHDGEEVISVELISLLPSKFRDLLENKTEKRDRIIEDIVKK
jgi:hypothetical protein